MGYVKHIVGVGDTLTPMACQLKQRDASGILQPVSLAGLTPKFSMVRSDGTVIVSESVAGVSITDSDTGKVQYDFQPSDVTTEGTYYGWWSVYSGTQKDTYPAGGRKLEILIVAAD